MSTWLRTEAGARAGIIAVKLEHTEIFFIPSFEISTWRFEMWNFPVRQFLVYVWIVVTVGRSSIPSAPRGNSVHHKHVPDSSIQVTNKPSTDCLNHAFFLIKWKRLGVFSLGCQLYLRITAFLNLISQSKTPSDPGTVITVRGRVQVWSKSASSCHITC